MTKEFEEVGHSGFMKHNGGLQLREISGTEFEFRARIEDIHLNSGGITHGGFITSLMDSGLGTSAYRSLGSNTRIATISLDVKFISATRSGDILTGKAKVLKKTRSLVFMRGELWCESLLVSTGEGIWKLID